MTVREEQLGRGSDRERVYVALPGEGTAAATGSNMTVDAAMRTCERGRGEGRPAVQSGEPGEYSGENAQGEARGEAVETVEGTYHRVPYASCYCTRAAAVT